MPDKTRETKIYHRRKYQLFFLGFFLDAVLLITLAVSGLSVDLRNYSSQISSNFFILNAIYILIFAAGMYLAHFPFRWYEEFIWEHKFNLSTQNFNAWLCDDLKKNLINILVMLLAVEVIYALLRQFSDMWWVGAGVFWLLLTLVLARLTPNVIIPLFYKYANLKNQELKSRVLALFKGAQIKVKDAYLINFSSKTKKANAFICGLGASRRVVLSDTLVDQFTIPEIETVVAHEIGHYKGHDILKLTVINSIVVFLGFFLVNQFLRGALSVFHLKEIHDIAFFPVVALALSFLGFLATPLLNGYSRSLEIKADAFSLRLTKSPADFISMIGKLGEMNLAEFEPGLWVEVFFYTHPPIAKRIKFARDFRL